MNEIIVPEGLTINLFQDFLKNDPDYTITDTSNDYTINDLPLGTYFFNITGTYNTDPISEEYRGFILYEDKVVDWTGRAQEKNQTIQEYVFSCYLAIPTLTVNLTYDGSAYTGATVKIGEDTDLLKPRTATDNVDGTYTLNNVRRNDSIKIAATPADSEDGVKTEEKTVDIANTSKSVDMSLYFYYYLEIYTYDGNSQLVRCPEATLYDSIGAPITKLSPTGNNALRSDIKIKNGTYTIVTDRFETTEHEDGDYTEPVTFQSRELDITLDNTNKAEVISKSIYLYPVS